MPYVAIPVAMIVCGIGLPVPEELVLVWAGYLSYSSGVHFGLIFGICVLSILAGDLVPFMLGKVFGPKLLKLRIVRTWMHTERLARFDAFFTKHGRLTILVARFLTGVRIPAFFTAGSMGMSIVRFLIMDGIGALIGCTIFVSLGKFNGEHIDQVIEWVKKTELGILIVVGVAVVAAAIYLWYRLRRRKRLLGKDVREAFVGPPSMDELGSGEKTAPPEKELAREPPGSTDEEPVRKTPQSRPEKKNGAGLAAGHRTKEPPDLGS